MTGAIEVSIANMYKEDRSATEEVYVVGFVPSHMLPKKQPNALDPFLEPLISEIENIFIDGICLFSTIYTVAEYPYPHTEVHRKFSGASISKGN